jgi:hypothetical protein
MEAKVLMTPQIKKLAAEAKRALTDAMNIQHIRSDYKEIVELSLIVLGVKPRTAYMLKRPGANHRARWMARVIYSIKIYLLRKVYKMPIDVENKFKHLSLFFALIYVKNWVTSPLAADAAVNDLTLYKQLEQ